MHTNITEHEKDFFKYWIFNIFKQNKLVLQKLVPFKL